MFLYNLYRISCDFCGIAEETGFCFVRFCGSDIEIVVWLYLAVIF